MDLKSVPSTLIYWMGISVCIAFTASAAWAQPATPMGTSEGYLFIDGHYILPPYSIQITKDSLTVNDRTFTPEFFGAAVDEEELRGAIRAENGDRNKRLEMRDRIRKGEGLRRGDGGNWGNGSFRGARERRGTSPYGRASQLIGECQIGAIVVVFENTLPAVFYPNYGGDLLLETLSGIADQEEQALKKIAPKDHATAQRLLSEFSRSEEFITRVKAQHEQQAALGDAADRTTAANLLVARISYPMTVLAMVFVVLGFGHLLSNRPMQSEESALSTANRTVMIKSLSIIALLSIVDLVWTIAGANSGTMRELNPLGSHFIHDPTSLIFFKLIVTGTALGILYALRQKPIAHVASWWCCLLLTLLTARWVVFQSMFV
ncbi:DUF5658 family protein [Planctomycetes bacterium K23_9]|uniref:DUF5658 domain-containing protein n=1 Tax=Stieleria marina TaxID=1930275 RepID=A0A517NX73_9BACT|nr:hypothetical protein K239x_37350 [Planctomycetes bacterium K23_9]